MKAFAVDIVFWSVRWCLNAYIFPIYDSTAIWHTGLFEKVIFNFLKLTSSAGPPKKVFSLQKNGFDCALNTIALNVSALNIYHKPTVA